MKECVKCGKGEAWAANSNCWNCQMELIKNESLRLSPPLYIFHPQDPMLKKLREYLKQLGEDK